MRWRCLSSVFSSVIIATWAYPLLAQQSDAAISPSLSMPAKGGVKAAGLALTLAGSPRFALRASAHVALKRVEPTDPGLTTWLPPWTVDADAVFALAGRPLGSHNRTA